jgi:hypothetical protein
MVTYKYYDIYMTYQLGISGHPDPPTGPDVAW